MNSLLTLNNLTILSLVPLSPEKVPPIFAPYPKPPKARYSQLEPLVDKIRVVVANRPRLMRELVAVTISDQPDMEVVGEAENDAQITELVDRFRPDCLIIALEEPDPRPGLCGFLLGRYPQMRVLALAPERNTGIAYWAFVDIRTRRIQTSEEEILNVLRKSAPAADRPRSVC